MIISQNYIIVYELPMKFWIINYETKLVWFYISENYCFICDYKFFQT